MPFPVADLRIALKSIPEDGTDDVEFDPRDGRPCRTKVAPPHPDTKYLSVQHLAVTQDVG